jgi:hypothetical protein
MASKEAKLKFYTKMLGFVDFVNQNSKGTRKDLL